MLESKKYQDSSLFGFTRVMKGKTMKASRLVAVYALLLAGSVTFGAQAALAASASAASTTVSAQLVSDNHEMVCPTGTGCNTVSANNNSVGVLNLKQSFAGTIQVCVSFGFGAKDLLDPGDAVNLQFRDPITNAVYQPVSVANVGTTSQASRLSCFTAVERPDLINLFLTGSNQKINFSEYANAGSAYNASVSVTVTKLA